MRYALAELVANAQPLVMQRGYPTRYMACTELTDESPSLFVQPLATLLPRICLVFCGH